MAYFDTNSDGLPGRYATVRDVANAPQVASFSALEWTVLAIARRDAPRRFGGPGRFAALVRLMFGRTGDLRLADPRLESLRRTAIFARRVGSRLSAAIVDQFHAAGFTPAQLVTLLESVEHDHVAQFKGRLA
jgi:hypothetical protein